jgi:hypothetical protein
MKQIFTSLLFLIMFSGFAISQDKPVYANGYVVKTGDMAPDFTIKESDGKKYKL